MDYRRHGVRYRKHFHTREIAFKFFRKIQDLLDSERAGLEGIEPITFYEFCDLFMANHFKEKSHRYKIDMAYKIRRFCNVFGGFEMTEITNSAIQDFYEKRKMEGIAPKTLREDLSALNLLFNAAIKNSYAIKNPVKDIERPRNIPAKVRALVPDQILIEVLKKAGTLETNIMLLLRNTGMRWGELFRVNWQDIDYENQLIHIQSNLSGHTKNYHSRHTILTPTSAMIFKMWGKRSPLISIKQRTLEARFYDFKKKYSIDWDLHSLRHTFVTKLRHSNIPERVVAHYVGHAQKGITDHYTSYTREFIETSIDAVDFGGEFIKKEESIATSLPPAFKNINKNNILNMPGTGFENDQPRNVKRISQSSIPLKNKKIWLKA